MLHIAFEVEVWGPVLGHKRRKLVFRTSEEPKELGISPRTSLNINVFSYRFVKTNSVPEKKRFMVQFSASGPSSRPQIKRVGPIINIREGFLIFFSIYVKSL